MKKWNLLYENCKLPIRIAYFGFALIAIGFLIQNESVNVFYTIENTYIIILSEALLKIGEAIINNLPLIFMVNLVAKRANSGVPTLLAIVGYFSYLVFTMIFTDPGLAQTAYRSILAISFDATYLPIPTSGIRYPLETGLIGTFIVAFAVRYCYIKSRNRSSYSLIGFLDKDSAAVIYTIVLCAILGILTAFIYPSLFGFITNIINYIAKDISDPIRIGIYGLMDRVLSLFHLGNIIRYPFWYTSLGGSALTLSGQAILGDVNIWTTIQDTASSFLSGSNIFGTGRFITPYYIINLFIIPAFYFGIYFVTSNSKAKRKAFVLFIFGSILSILAGNPLPLELILLFTAPLLLFIYWIIVAILFALCSWQSLFLGFSYSGSTVTAMPGSFADYIINLRSPILFDTIFKIAIIGLIVAFIIFIIVVLYYRYLAYDLLKTGKTKRLAMELIKAVGGLDNIKICNASIDRICFELNDFAMLNYELLSKCGSKRIIETKTGILMDYSSSSIIIARMINKIKKDLIRK